MKTILLISPYWREAHRWMVSSVKLAELWQRLGYRVVVVCMGRVTAASCENEKLPEREAAKGVYSRSSKLEARSFKRVSVEHVSHTLVLHRMQDVFLKDPWNYGIAFGFSGYVKRLADELKPEVIVVNKVLFWTSLAAIRLRLSGQRVLLLTDALVGMTWWPRGRLPKIAARIYAWTLGWLILRCAAHVVFFHPQPPALLQRLRIRKKSRVIPTGIDPSGYGPPERDAEKIVVTYVGRLESVKGVDDFLAAATIAANENPRVRIQVAGYFQDPHPLVQRYDREAAFLGLQDDIPALLRQTDIFVLPSYSEGLSNALMEAMASGCACIASDVGGNTFLLQNGVSGLLFPAGDREALKAHILRLAADPAKREAMGREARKRIEEVFAWGKVDKEYQRLFDDYVA